MKILVIGSGGREHALCWKIAQSKKVKKIYCAPGNGGISSIAENVDIKADDVKALLEFAKSRDIGLTVVGPEAPLVTGIADEFNEHGLRIFGPVKEAAHLEGSKIFAKELMRRHGVPTAEFEAFDNPDTALNYVKRCKIPVVVKTDGLAAGKGVVVCQSREEAGNAVKNMMVAKEFGSSGEKLVIEECLLGEEASFIVISDGKEVMPLASSQDHKRVFDGDKGQNTGGMGAYSPAPVVTPDIEKKIMREIIRPVIDGMGEDGIPYKGVLYAGIMVTAEGPKALEFNVRFGDPETQAILPRLKSDLVDIMEDSIDGKLRGKKAEWSDSACICVVLASGGYPGSYEKGKIIKGLDNAKKREGVAVFHAGTRTAKIGGREEIVTAGGRVLGVTAIGGDIRDALNRAYAAVGDIKFDGIQYRRDIGKRALERVQS